MHPRAIGAAEVSCQIQHPREPRFVGRFGCIAGVPGGAGLPLGVCVCKQHIAGLHRDAVAIDLPPHIGAEPVERQHRVFKNTGQQERTRGDGQSRFATALGHVDVHGGAAQPQVCGGGIGGPARQ